MSAPQPRLLTKPDKTRAPSTDHQQQPASQEQPPVRQAAPYVLVSKEWQLQPEGVGAGVLSEEPDFLVVGVLGGPGLGKSSFLNALLGVGEGSDAAGSCPPFPVLSEEQRLAGQHCSSGIQIRVGEDGIIALDTQPLFSLSVLADVARWDRPSLALAAPAVAAASAAKSSVVPFEAAQRLMELQAGVLLLSVCHLVVVMCDGLHDQATWEFLQTLEMLARGIPDPTMPQPPAAPAAGSTAPGGKATLPPAAQQQQPQHLADVLLLHMVDTPGQGAGVPGSSGPSCLPGVEKVGELEERLREFFAPSRLAQPGPISLLDFLQQRAPGAAPGSGGAQPPDGSPPCGRLSYWVLPRAAPAGALPGGAGAAAAAPAAEGEGWREGLLRRLLHYPRRGFARRASQRAWGAGTAAAWEAVAKSPELLDYYSRLVRTVYKGAGGWGLAR